MENNQENVIEVKKPKRIIHCSDGIYEEYDSDDDKEKIAEDNKNRSWPIRAAHSLINALDYAGETLADFFNITTPKYSYEIEQFKKDQVARAKEEAEEKANTWDVEKSNASQPVTEVPKSKNMEKY